AYGLVVSLLCPVESAGTGSNYYKF
ncbi:hypothetical protein [truncated ORF], partial [Aspergillus niger]|uniref:Uncharacterized protein n=2 Tax=Aspergillus niger TaxID=5061 RepID=A0AAJ8BWL8_ASPNG